MLDLRRTNAECQGAQATMARGVAVAAHNRGAGKRKALLWSNDMDDTLLGIGGIDVVDAEFRRVSLQRFQLLGAFRVCNRDWLSVAIKTRGGGQVVIRHSQCQIWPANTASCRP